MIAVPDALEVADSVPQVAPEHPVPVSVQVTPLFSASFCTVAVMVWVWPVCTDTATGFTDTTIAGGAALVTVNVVTAVLVTSATDLAVSVTAAGVGALAGAVYVMAVPDALEVVESVPQDAPEQPAPVNVQVTPLFWVSFCSVAVMLCV